MHKLAGGGRVVDVLGRDEAEISFSGFFSGSEATSRARQVDFLRTSGAILPLRWDVFYYTVILRDFFANYTNGFWIPFRVRCTVIRDESAPVTQYSVSTTSSIEADTASAISLAVQAGLQLGLPSTGVASLSSLQSAQAQLTNANSSLQQSWDPGSLDTVSTAASGISALQTASSATENLANTNSVDWVYRKSHTEHYERRSSLMKSLVVAGGNLYQIAARELGDATQWIRIAQLNDLSDPMLSGVVTLIIPAPDPNAGGGIVQQQS